MIIRSLNADEADVLRGKGNWMDTVHPQCSDDPRRGPARCCNGGKGDITGHPQSRIGGLIPFLSCSAF